MKTDTTTLAPARTTLTVEIPMQPPIECSPNWYGPWQKKAAAVKSFRHAAGWTSMDAKLRMFTEHCTDDIVFFGPVAIHAVIHWGKGRKRMDDTNAPITLKAAIDGLQDADVFLNDKQVKRLTVEQVRAADGVGKVVMTIVEMGEAP